MTTQPVHTISQPSVRSLLLILQANGKPLSTATGFLVSQDGRNYLVTNWHVVSGRHPETGQPLSSTTGAVPDTVLIAHNTAGKLGTWHPIVESLYDKNGRPLWREHP